MKKDESGRNDVRIDEVEGMEREGRRITGYGRHFIESAIMVLYRCEQEEENGGDDRWLC